ncbi:MAG: hypothetical protein HYY04_04085 [Chloroflexi bacterium]|nr:hypothetical protein [Chloroflexota bacterium]
MSDVAAHAERVAAARRAAEGLRYLSDELRTLLEVVVRDRRRGVLDGAARRAEVDAPLALLAELASGAPPSPQRELQRLHTT